MVWTSHLSKCQKVYIMIKKMIIKIATKFWRIPLTVESFFFFSVDFINNSDNICNYLPASKITGKSELSQYTSSKKYFLFLERKNIFLLKESKRSSESFPVISHSSLWSMKPHNTFSIHEKP
ncbi:hypothetical protein V8G54_008519 [Vigna mungo]|uniref:Uncharacterized protein n=1 Tax=Vigna mungo TaxID=3915 RepID=A0AAQ3S8A9_VIGMU